MLLSATGAHRHGLGERPDRALPRARDAVDRALRARGERPAPDASRRRPRSSTSCSAACRRPSSSTASPSCTARPARRTSSPSSEFLANNVLLENGLMLAGLALLLVGLGFKVAAVPFHSWVPDVYQGSPTPITGFMASAAKAAAFAALLRVFVVAFETYQLDWKPMVWVLAVLTHGRRLGARGRADRREADAGVLVDQPRRLRPRRRAGGERARDRQRRSSTCSPTRSWCSARSPSSPSSARRATRTTTSATFRGLVAAAPGARVRVHRVPARPGRRAAHLRLLREVLRDRRRGRRRVLRARASSRWSRRSSPRSSICGSSS